MTRGVSTMLSIIERIDLHRLVPVSVLVEQPLQFLDLAPIDGRQGWDAPILWGIGAGAFWRDSSAAFSASSSVRRAFIAG